MVALLIENIKQLINFVSTLLKLLFTQQKLVKIINFKKLNKINLLSINTEEIKNEQAKFLWTIHNRIDFLVMTKYQIREE